MPYVDDDEPPGAGFRGVRPGESVADLGFEPGPAGGWDDDGAGAYDGGPGPSGGAGPRWRGWPVYLGRGGGRSRRGVGRPRGRGRGRELEIVALHPELAGEEELFPINAAPHAARAFVHAPSSRGVRARKAARELGWRLRLPHAALHTILARLRPEQLRALAGGRLSADPSAAVVGAVGALARRARPAARLAGGFTVFATPGWRLLVRPLGELQGEIVSVRPVEGESQEGETPGGGPGAGRPRPPTPAAKTPSKATKTPSRTVKITFEWLMGCTLSQSCPEHRNGYYVIYNPKGKPVYAGHMTDFRRLMSVYAEYARVFERDLAQYAVYFAQALGLSHDTLERYVIRSILTLAGSVQNVEGIEPHVLDSRRIVVTHVGKSAFIPGFLKVTRSRTDRNGRRIDHVWNGTTAVTTITAGAEYELPSHAG